MEFDIEKRGKRIRSNYLEDDLEVARKFAKIMYKELGTFIQGLVLFGSATKAPHSKEKDLDILVILDDVHIKFSKELVETYRIITEKAIAEVDPKRLHIQSMKFTSFWEYVRAGDAVAINILRSGIALIDTGFFDPLQELLDQGRIRPSKEAVYTYFTMAPASLHRSQQHILTAMIDLYWAVIDSAHAALMAMGEIPPSPEHVADMLEKKLVANKEIRKEQADTMRKLYTTFKKITHREIKEVSGADYDRYYRLATRFVSEMKRYIEKK